MIQHSHHQISSRCKLRIRNGQSERRSVRPSLKMFFVAGFTSLLLTGGSVAGEPADLDEKSSVAPPANEDVGILQRKTLLGDWGGLRPALADKGISWDLSYTAVYAGVFEGGARDKSFDWGHRVDAFIRADTSKLGLWDGGGLHVHLESKHGDSPRRPFPRSGGLWPPNSSATVPISGPDQLVASAIYYSHKIGDNGLLMIGKINALDLLASDPFFGGLGRDRFSNIAFTAPPSGVVPPVIMGAVYSHRVEPFAITFMVYDPNDWTDDYWPEGIFDDGVNLSLGITWSGKVLGRASSLGITGTYSTQEGVDLRDLLLPPGLVAGTKKGSYNISLSASHLFWESPDHPGKGLGLYLRAAIADGNPNPISSSIVGGFAGYGVIPGRPDDVVGIGYYHYNFSDELRFGAAPLVKLGDETGVEAFYNMAVAPWFHVSAGVQWIEPIQADLPESWLGGIRARIDF